MAPRATDSAGPHSPRRWPPQRQAPCAGTPGEPRARRRLGTDPPAAPRGAAALPCLHRAHGAHPPAVCLPSPPGLVLGRAQGPVASNRHQVTADSGCGRAGVVTSPDSEKGTGGEQRKREGGAGVLPSGLPPTAAGFPSAAPPACQQQVSSQNPSQGQRWNPHVSTRTAENHTKGARTGLQDTAPPLLRPSSPP